MNQSILFNDDLNLVKPGTWQLSGFYQGELLIFQILTSVTEINDGLKFDWEAEIEDWLDANEPDQSPIVLHLD